ncbi:MAG: fimbrillin family protein [Alistipes sp.]|nr:fimbrillin family protein [Alistipes sp.]
MKAKYLYIVSALTLGLVGCSQEYQNVEAPLNNSMTFNIVSPNATRVSDGVFEAEDKVGVYVTDYADNTTPMPLQISGNRANNQALIFDGASWASERTIYWGEGKSDVYAYYPYMEIEDVDEQPFSVALDQDADGAYEASDLLWAKAEGVAQADGAVSLAMNHAMSRLIVKIMAGEEYIGSLPKDATVHLHSTVTDAHISLANGSVVKDPYSGAKSIKMRNLGIHTFAEGEAVVYEAIVVPQMLETSVPLLEINSKSVSYLLEDMFNFKPGVSYTYTAILNTSTTAIKIDIGCEVEDWNNIGGGSEGEGGSGSEGGDDDGIDLSLYIDLSAEGTANCYLIKAAGNYKFKAVIGNIDASVGNVKKSEVLWETFGNDVKPNVGDLIKEVGYKNGYVYFSTPEAFANGNASIAVRNSKDVILWSWHIWCSEEGWIDQVYANDAGTMMDRNLGATSATPGDIGAFGLMYQWGRKDPFMGTCAKSGTTFAASTGVWDVSSSSNKMDFAEENPMTFATDWYGGSVPGNGWHTSESVKGLYDPCPVGYRVPDGGENGFWTTALGTSSSTSTGTKWDSTNSGRHWTLADGTTAAWYPAVGYRSSTSGSLNNVGVYGYCWSASPGPSNTNYYACHLSFDKHYSEILNNGSRGYGCSVRCVRE